MDSLSFPHCDQRILHAPRECRWCDERPEWQELREAWGISFTGHPHPASIIEVDPPGTVQQSHLYQVLVERHERPVLPCPADFARPPTGESPDHRRWAGNVATTQSPVNESAASLMMYPDSVVNRQLATTRRNKTFMERLRANVAKHRDLLDRLR